MAVVRIAENFLIEPLVFEALRFVPLVGSGLRNPGRRCPAARAARWTKERARRRIGFARVTE